MEHQARQVYVRHDDWHKFVAGCRVTGYDDNAGNPEGYRHINVAGDEVIEDHGGSVTIEKHY